LCQSHGVWNPTVFLHAWQTSSGWPVIALEEALICFGIRNRDHNKLPLKLHTALVRAIIHHSLKLHFAWLRCLHCMSFLFARTLHLPALTLCSFACLPAGLCWRIPPLLLRACESVWCLRGLLVRECPALVCACLPCACACALNAFRPHTQLR